MYQVKYNYSNNFFIPKSKYSKRNKFPNTFPTFNFISTLSNHENYVMLQKYNSFYKESHMGILFKRQLFFYKANPFQSETKFSLR